MSEYFIKHKSGWKVRLFSNDINEAMVEAAEHAEAIQYKDCLTLIEVDKDKNIYYRANSDSDWEVINE